MIIILLKDNLSLVSWAQTSFILMNIICSCSGGFLFHVVGADDHKPVVSCIDSALIKPCPAGSIEIHAGLIQKHNICIAQDAKACLTRCFMPELK
jgi:hypothetical protein